MDFSALAKATKQQALDTAPIEKPADLAAKGEDILNAIQGRKAISTRARLEAVGLGALAESIHFIPAKSITRLNDFITEDKDMIQLKRRVMLLAELNDPVLIHGETGTGKEIIASALHGWRTGKFLAINTTSLPDNLLESELFGHVAGSFTGANTSRVGKLEAAENGTIFLDEIGDMKPNLQEKLLRALQEKVITPVGTNEERPINCRVIAATHKVIRKECPTTHEVTWLSTFREDLYWRIATYEVFITPLRERKGDIREILDARFDPEGLITESERDVIEQLPLTGNVRELDSRVKRILVEKNMEKMMSKLSTNGVIAGTDTAVSPVVT